jgi:elongation factor Ts
MEISANTIKELREKTGAGIMDCKKALQETKGNIEEAIEYLRKKGISSASKKFDRTTKEGLISAYIHTGGRIGVMVEVNCETDFVARTDDFQQIVKDIAMQIAATDPLVVSQDQLAPEKIEKEKEIYIAQMQDSGKPQNIIEKIVNEKLEKFYSESCLLRQPFIKNPDKTVKDIISEYIAKLGENITVKRFIRYRLGE